MKPYLDRLRRAYGRKRREIEQITACVLGLTIGIALGALSLASPEHHAAVRSHAASTAMAHHAPRPAP